MSRTIEGRYVCDRCGADVAAGGVASSVLITDVVPGDRGGLRSLNLCRDRIEGEDGNTREVAGCERGLVAYLADGPGGTGD